MKLLRDNVCIKPVRLDDQYTGPLVMPEKSDMRPQAKGVVLFTGPLVREVRPGDHVWYETFDWTPGKVDTIIIKESEVMARCKGEEHKEDATLSTNPTVTARNAKGYLTNGRHM